MYIIITSPLVAHVHNIVYYNGECTNTLQCARLNLKKEQKSYHGAVLVLFCFCFIIVVVVVAIVVVVVFKLEEVSVALFTKTVIISPKREVRKTDSKHYRGTMPRQTAGRTPARP